MKIFRFVKKAFFLGLTILSNLTNPLDCISMKNQEFKITPEIVIIMIIILCLTLLVLK